MSRTPPKSETPEFSSRGVRWQKPKNGARPPVAPAMPTELGGRDGPEPVRYGDWEKKGIAVDF